MKAFVALAVVVACVYGHIVPDRRKLIPSFSSNFFIKGHEAVPNSAPYIVSLSRNAVNHSHFCGGTIFDKEWVITAAHCIPEGGPVGISVVAGLHDQLNIDNKTQSSIVDWGVVHEEYKNRVGPFDISILHLSTPFKFNKYVKPAILPAHEETQTGETHLYGWGQPNPYPFIGAKVLQTVTTEIMSFKDCKASLPENSPIHESNICSDSLQKSISACNGDSGGPLVIEHEYMESELIGVVSWGYIPCGVKNLPSVYTRVSAHKAWICKMQDKYYVSKK